MNKGKKILAKQRKQDKLKKEIKNIKKKVPIYLLGIVFVMFIVVYKLEHKVYIYFGGTLLFITISLFFTLFICCVYYFRSKMKIQEKEELSKAIGSKLYHLMKLENE